MSLNKSLLLQTDFLRYFVTTMECRPTEIEKSGTPLDIMGREGISEELTSSKDWKNERLSPLKGRGTIWAEEIAGAKGAGESEPIMVKTQVATRKSGEHDKDDDGWRIG